MNKTGNMHKPACLGHNNFSRSYMHVKTYSAYRIKRNIRILFADYDSIFAMENKL